MMTGGNNGVTHLKSTEIYNLITNTWTPAADMNKPRFGHASVRLLDGKVLVIGGNSFDYGTDDSTEIYDPATDTWSTSAPMLTKRSGHAAVTLPNGNVIVTGGTNNEGSLNSTEIYNPIDNTWTPGPDMGATRQEHSAVLLDDGRVMVIGGTVNGMMSKRTEIYDPTNNSWTAGPDLPSARYVMAAATAEDGRVYVTGGLDGSYSPLTSVMVYDSEVNSWNSIGSSMKFGRLVHTASAFLNGNGILIAGGSGNSGATNTSEMFQPSLRTHRPELSLPSGDVPNGTPITLSSKTPGAVIYYTTDGSTPQPNSTVYSGPISITETMTLKAIAIKPGWDQSQEISVSYNVLANANTPIIDTQPTDQTVNVDGDATLIVAASGGESLSYQWFSNTTINTTDGTLIPGATSPTYAAPTGVAGTTYYYCIITNTDTNATGQQTATAISNVVMVSVASNSPKAIMGFSFNGLKPTVTGTVYESTKTVELTVPYGTDVTALEPTIIHTGVSVSPASGTVQDFTTPVLYTVTAADNSTQSYTVTVNVASNSAKSITGFSFNLLKRTVTGKVNESAKTVELTVPYGTDVTALEPTDDYPYGSECVAS